jgi:hypothetical protein
MAIGPVRLLVLGFEQQLPVIEEDPHLLRLAFRLDVPHERTRARSSTSSTASRRSWWSAPTRQTAAS